MVVDQDDGGENKGWEKKRRDGEKYKRKEAVSVIAGKEGGKWLEKRAEAALFTSELEKKGRGKEGEVLEGEGKQKKKRKEQANFVLPSGYLLLLLNTSDMGWISNALPKTGTEQQLVWYNPYLQIK